MENDKRFVAIGRAKEKAERKKEEERRAIEERKARAVDGLRKIKERWARICDLYKEIEKAGFVPFYPCVKANNGDFVEFHDYNGRALHAWGECGNLYIYFGEKIESSCSALGLPLLEKIKMWEFVAESFPALESAFYEWFDNEFEPE